MVGYPFLICLSLPPHPREASSLLTVFLFLCSTRFSFLLLFLKLIRKKGGAEQSGPAALEPLPSFLFSLFLIKHRTTIFLIHCGFTSYKERFHNQA